MGRLLKLPIPVERAQTPTGFRFSTTIIERGYDFVFDYNPLNDFFVLRIQNPDGDQVLNEKVVYGTLYEVDEHFVLKFFDPQGGASTVNGSTIGDPVIGGVGLLDG